MMETAERLKAEAEAAKTSGGERQAAAHSQLAWREGTPVEERLKYALTKGIGDYLEEDLAEALKLYPKAVSIRRSAASGRRFKTTSSMRSNISAGISV